MVGSALLSVPAGPCAGKSTLGGSGGQSGAPRMCHQRAPNSPIVTHGTQVCVLKLKRRPGGEAGQDCAVPHGWPFRHGWKPPLGVRTRTLPTPAQMLAVAAVKGASASSASRGASIRWEVEGPGRPIVAGRFVGGLYAG